MLRFIGTRLLQVVPTLLLVSVMVFLLQELTPGDPAVALAGEERGDPVVLAQIRAELWLDRPLIVQYGHWMGNLLHGNLGFSWLTPHAGADADPAEAAGDRCSWAAWRSPSRVLIGVPAGVLAAVKRNTVWDYAANFIGLAGLVDAEFLARHHADPAGVGASGLAAAVRLRAAWPRIGGSRWRPRSCRPSCWATPSRRC